MWHFSSTKQEGKVQGAQHIRDAIWRALRALGCLAKHFLAKSSPWVSLVLLRFAGGRTRMCICISFLLFWLPGLLSPAADLTIPLDPTLTNFNGSKVLKLNHFVPLENNPWPLCCITSFASVSASLLLPLPVLSPAPWNGKEAGISKEPTATFSLSMSSLLGHAGLWNLCMELGCGVTPTPSTINDLAYSSACPAPTPAALCLDKWKIYPK